ncbi:EF-hand domain-containing protein [Brevundimonas sp.]|uniref:EF-hand domain-containing protein n=1 Tax=Brevundimonas sp. TaxID=1871086 RepID=UPI00286A1B54|nr:EF-hand domain-containing protein [Brevundimonas sp.]
MSVIAIALLAALNGAAPQDQAAPRVETRSEIRIVTAGGEGPGRLDADGDGMVTREEFTTPLGNAFDRLDADNDGRLSTEELAAGHGEGGPGHRMMMMGGPGGPGVHIITREGGPGGHGAPGVMMFGGPDGPGGPGGDVQVFTFRSGGPVGGPAHMEPQGPGSHQVFVRRFGGPDGPGEMDKDGDGKVSQEEFLAPLREAFGRMDADSDGFLDDGEGRPTPPSAD